MNDSDGNGLADEELVAVVSEEHHGFETPGDGVRVF